MYSTPHRELRDLCQVPANKIIIVKEWKIKSIVLELLMKSWLQGAHYQKKFPIAAIVNVMDNTLIDINTCRWF